uniref:PGC-1 and ERR-induced regulator in muscle protein 1 n=1 Tax=Leptobrachium leishanense TaxID=445787 RepID=A0A8C5MRS3_9ANUR
MDNFEYSIQISDRDWAEFYSTAEECGLKQVSLASDEELLFSDPELDDNTNRSKLIRVSLCPPREEQHAIQSTNTGPSPGDPACYRPKGPREDILLSGSEDEEEFGSVTRFLCQRETLFQKGLNIDPSVDIPVPSKTKTPLMCPENEGFYSNGCAPSVQPTVPSRTREESMLQNETNDPLDCARTGGVGHSPINGNGFPHPEVNVHNEVLDVDVNDCPEMGKSSGLNGFPDDTGHRHVPTVRNEEEVQEEVQHRSRETSIDELQTDNQHEFRPSDPTRDDIEHTGLEMDSGLQEATRARIHSSAVKQNILDPFTILIPKSGSPEFKKISNVDKSVDKCILGFQNVCPTSSPAPVSISEQVLLNQGLSASPRLAPSTNVALTTPEMYDFFYSDVSETANMDTNPEAKHVEDDGIMYTPDMYEYFFLENEEESKSKGKAQPKEQPCKEMVLNSPEIPKSDVAAAAVDFCLPDAYEFFFADDAGDESSGGNALSTPAFHAQTAAVASLQSFLPQGPCRVRKGFTVRGSRCKTGRDGQLNQHSMPGEAAGSRVLRVPAGTGDACLVFLAFASWAMKTSDMRSPDGWKTALLANIGAVSAIQYMRKNTRRNRSDSTTDECEEGP